MSLGRYTGTADSNIKQLYLDGKEFYSKPVLQRVKLLKENFSYFSYNSKYFRSEYMYFQFNKQTAFKIIGVEILHYRFRLKTVVKEIMDKNELNKIYRV